MQYVPRFHCQHAADYAFKPLRLAGNILLEVVAPRANTILQYIGANVRRLRLARGWTQSELAEATGKKDGLKKRYVQILEAGSANPTVKALIVVADVLGVSPTDLFAPTKLEVRPTGRPPSEK